MSSKQDPSIRILNDNGLAKQSTKLAVDVSKSLQKLMLRMKGEYMTIDGQGVDYDGIRKSSLLTEYEEETYLLCDLDILALSEDDKMAFFINIYNALTIHGLIREDKLPSSILDVRLFWKKTAYRINSHVFSLDDIEHGVLRGNRPHPASQSLPFGSKDPRLSFVMMKFDPRIHFALVCGAKSCPAINVYTAENLNTALDVATRSFCSQEVKLYEMRKEIRISRIFQWYQKDFGSNDVEAIRWTLPYLTADEQRIMKLLLFTLEEHGMVDLVYKEYDWKLNKLEETAPPVPTNTQTTSKIA